MEPVNLYQEKKRCLLIVEIVEIHKEITTNIILDFMVFFLNIVKHN